MNSSFAGFTADKGSMAGVETVNLTNETTIAREFDASGVSGVTSYNIDATNATVNLKDLAEAVNVSLSNAASGTTSISFNDVANSTDDVPGGTEDAITVALSNNGTLEDDSTDAIERKEVTLTVNSIEELTLDVTGDNVVQLGANDATAIIVTGSGSLDMDTVSTATKTFDGSAVTGNILLDATASSSSTTSIKTGSGDDEVTIDTEKMAANATLSGGVGEDTLTLTSVNGNATTQFTMSGFETIELGAMNGGQTFSGKNYSDVTGVKTLATANQDVTFVNMGDQDLAITASTTAADKTISSDHTGATTVNFNATAATVAKGTKNTAADTVNEIVSVAKSSDLTVNVGEYASASGNVTAALAGTVTLNVASGLDADDAELTTYTGTITAAKAKEVTINNTGTFGGNVTAATAESFTLNATGSANGSTIAVAAATSGEMTFAKADSMTLTAAALEVLNVTTGSKAVTISNTTGALQELAVNAGNAFTMAGALADIASVTVEGAGTSSAVTLGALGDGANDYDMSVTAGGLKGGFTTGKIAVADGADITIDTTSVTGNVTIGDIDDGVGANDTAGDAERVVITTAGKNVSIATVEASDVVTITASNSGTLSIGAIGDSVATADVTLNLDDVKGAITLGAIDGKTVTIDASAAIGGVTYGGTVTATKAANITGSELTANSSVAVTLDATSNDVSSSFTGGIGNDDITFVLSNATKKLTSLTVTGDSGTDTVTVDNSAGAAAVTTTGLSLSGVEKFHIDNNNNTAGDEITLNASAFSGQAIAFDAVDAGSVLYLTGTDAADTIDMTKATAGVAALAGDVAFSHSASKGNDTYKLSAAGVAAETIVFDDTSGSDTITNFKVGEDFLDFDSITGISGNGVDAPAAGVDGAVVDPTDSEIYVFATSADSGFADGSITTMTNTTEVAAYLEAELTPLDAENFVAVINEVATKKAYIYLIDVDGETTAANTIEAGDLTLIGVVTADTALTATEIV